MTTDFCRAPQMARRVRPLARIKLTLVGLSGELRGGWRLAADLRSFWRFTADGFGYRAQRIVKVGGHRRRTIRFKDGTRLTYRVNRGDLRAIAEVWVAGAYELPFTVHPGNILDLGANIGTAGVWFVRRYGASRLVAVEPVAENAELARVNLARTGIATEVVTAAVGPRPGTARFQLNETSTLGRLGDQGIEVALVTPQSLIERFPPDEMIDLVKIDVEGGEEELFRGDLSWLDRVRCLVIELHTDRVDWRGIISKLEARGFSFHPIAQADLYRGPRDLMAAFRRIPQ